MTGAGNTPEFAQLQLIRVDFPSIDQEDTMHTIALEAMHDKLKEIIEPFTKLHINATVAQYTAVEMK